MPNNNNNNNNNGNNNGNNNNNGSESPPVQMSASQDSAHRAIAWRKIVVKAWNDPQFAAALIADPAAELAANFYPVKEGTTYTVQQEQPGHVTLTLPVKPSPVPEVVELSDYEPGF